MEVKAYPIVEVQVQLTGVEAERLTAIAAREGVSAADLIRRAIEAFLTSVAADERADDADWRALGSSAFEAGWDNPEDAVYDNWRELYGVGTR
ncbi:MAG: ribbon-helix-helix protein, CopG family [Chloroflexi bacterium]|nr:ribbon-helix-helix protein, CopG family [Chloroflexota bacterium]